ncbi:hypothetical protein [Methyloterricola oryzae]|uniref:hypothetical protein n=1 Tax=Methyloterricola oryzae TaxID=1495050 RepID=UPI00069C1188|nr:hypothetical protein [Methyloterricola oryzae]
MNRRKDASVQSWLGTKPSLAELRSRFPAEWDAVEAEFAAIVAKRDFKQLHARITSESGLMAGSPPKDRRGRAGDSRALVRKRMFGLLFKSYSLAAAAGGQGRRLRFGLVSGTLAQWLLFRRAFERKPVSLRWFRLLWPCIRQRDLLMPLVESKGIYCFYSRELVQRLASLIGGRTCLEIGAGDGTLARFLSDAGVSVTATDDHSWGHRIDYPASVLKLEASEALRRFKPRVVICSWPPAANRFERHIFQTASVELYIMIGSCYRTAAGDWKAYGAQREFSLELDTALSALVLPPELGSAVYVFRRKSLAAPSA